MLHFRLADAEIPCGATSATLTGTTFSGRELIGSDVVRTRGENESSDDSADATTLCGKALGADADKGAAPLAAPMIAPNPFNPMTHVLFSLAQPGRVQVAVYDLSGRRVALIADEVYGAGDQDVLWTGRDDDGRAVSSGVYFVRVEGAGLAASLRAVLLR